jgi:hypothetical protein
MELLLGRANKHQIQYPNVERLESGNWDLFVIWDL